MRMISRASWAAVLILAPAIAGAAEIRGEYVEARNADVFTGPCFSNAEIFIGGKQAVLAWKVKEGSWKGVDLAGYCVAAALLGDTTFSQDHPEKAQSILIVDSRASDRQQRALIDMAKTLGGARLGQVKSVATTRMSLTLEDHTTASDESAHSTHGMPHSARASFWAAGIAQIVTRPLDERDHFCGNEVVAYQPLSKGLDVQPAFTLDHEFKGKGLDRRWDDPNCRSSFVGHFAY